MQHAGTNIYVPKINQREKQMIGGIFKVIPLLILQNGFLDYHWVLLDGFKCTRT